MSMTHGLSEDIQCHVWSHSLHSLQITRLEIRHVMGCQPDDCK